MNDEHHEPDDAQAPQLADRVKDSASQIWLAGLGAYSKAEEEGGKLFEALVKDGEKLEARTRAMVDKPLSAARETVETVRARATGSWGKVERAFDLRVSRALQRLRIPLGGDVEALEARVRTLEAQVEQLAAALKNQQKKQK